MATHSTKSILERHVQHWDFWRTCYSYQSDIFKLASDNTGFLRMVFNLFFFEQFYTNVIDRNKTKSPEYATSSSNDESI